MRNNHNGSCGQTLAYLDKRYQPVIYKNLQSANFTVAIGGHEWPLHGSYPVFMNKGDEIFLRLDMNLNAYAGIPFTDYGSWGFFSVHHIGCTCKEESTPDITFR